MRLWTRRGGNGIIGTCCWNRTPLLVSDMTDIHLPTVGGSRSSIVVLFGCTLEPVPVNLEADEIRQGFEYRFP